MNDINHSLNIKYNYNQHYKSWIIFIFFCIQNFIIGLYVTLFQSLYSILTKYYIQYNNVEFMFNFAIIIISISFVITTIPALYINLKYNIKLSFSLSALFLLIGNILYYFIDFNYLFIFIAGSMVGFATPLIMNCQMLFVDIWFKQKYKNIVNGIIFTSNCLGAGIGGIFALLFIDLNEKEVIVKSQVKSMFLFLIILCTILVLFHLFILINEPPSNYQNVENNNELDNSISGKLFFKKIRNCFKYKKIVISCLIFGNLLSCIALMGSQISLIIFPFGFDERFGNIINLVGILSGIIISSLYSVLFINKINLNKFLKIFLLLQLIVFNLIIIGLKYENKIVIIIGDILFCGSLFINISNIFEYCFINYRAISFIIINAVLLLFQQFLQSFFILLSSFFIGNNNKKDSYFILLFIQIINIITLGLSNIN